MTFKRTSSLDPSQTYEIQTRMGAVQYKADDLFYFSNGLYGFEEYKNYILTYPPIDSMPECYRFLQSIDEPEITMIVANIVVSTEGKNDFINFEHLTPHLDAKNLKIEDIMLFLIVSIHNDGPSTRLGINTKAPIIMVPSTQDAWQIILSESEYQVCRFID